MSDPLPAEVRAYLLDGETPVWSGRPQQGLVLTARDALLIPFSLLWGGFAIFWEWSALRAAAPFPFALFGVPFVLAGLFLIVGRFFLDAWLRDHISYVLTDRRALIIRTGPWPSFKVVALDRLSDLTLSLAGGGRGTIRFGAQAPLWGMTSNRTFAPWISALDPTPQFLGIEQAQRVFAIVQGGSLKAPAR